MVEEKSANGIRRWNVFGVGLAASLAPTILFTLSFGRAGHLTRDFLSFWVEILVGPVKYWLPILLGFPSKYAIHPMAGRAICVYVACVLLMLAHPVKPCLLTAWMTGIGFFAWYAWAFLAILPFEY